jgi:hypothetical protein
MAARTPQLAFLVDQLMPALQTKPPVLARKVFVRRRGGGVLMKIVQRSSIRLQLHNTINLALEVLAIFPV